MNEDLKPKIAIEVNEAWPTWKKWLASVINYSAVIVWVVATYEILSFLSGNPDLQWGAALYLSVVTPATAYGLLSLIAGTVILTYLNPWVRPSRYKDGSDHEKRSLVYYWIGAMLSIALVIFGAN
jgi:hypothetical protein